MEIIKTSWGEIVVIPETRNNSEFVYHLRSVRKIIDNDSNEIENAPAFMQVNEFTYASIADAKRSINGQPMQWISEEAEYRPEYFTRFQI